MTRAAPAEGDLLYVADAMCSWCWGFAPVVSALRRAEPERRWHLVHGGLRAGAAARVMDRAMRATLQGHWRQVQSRTGQAFCWNLLNHGALRRYDTGPAASACVTVREMDPGMELDYFLALQAVFYRDGRDISQRGHQIRVAADCGLDPQAFGARLGSAGTGRRVASDYRFARRLGVSGFPALLLVPGGGAQARSVTLGWRPLAEVQARLRLLTGKA